MPHATPDLSASPLMSEARSVERMNEGIACFNRKQFDRAMALMDEAIALSPRSALAYFNRGTLYFRLSDIPRMAQDFSVAFQLDPNNGEMLKNMSFLWLLADAPHPAIQVAQRCLELLPESEDAWLTLLGAHYAIGNIDTALRLCEHLANKFPRSTRVRMADALFVPQVAMSNEQIDTMRTRILAKLDGFLKDGLQFADPIAHMYNSLFFLPYQGRANKPMAEAIAQFYLKACPALTYTAAHCEKPRKALGEKLRVGFVSPSMHHVTLNQFFLALIEALEKTGEFETWIFSSAPAAHPEVVAIKQRMARYVDLPPEYDVSVQLIAKQKPDVLVYLEVGAHALMYALPFARLAPVQCVMGGLPVTTGIPNMDYFISSRGSEPEGAQEAYSETLILTDHDIAVISDMKAPAPTSATRTELGLPDGDVRLYACPVQLFKLHPDMDPVFEAILRRDPKARIVLYDNGKTILQSALRKRFAARMPQELCERIVFLPYVARVDFMQHMRAVDAVLDSFHFSFGTVAYLNIAAGVPFVTWPGPYFSGRCSHRLFTRLGLPELMAANHEEFVDIALKLAQDKDFYQKAAAKIAARSHELFDDYRSVDEFASILRYLYFSQPQKDSAA